MSMRTIRGAITVGNNTREDIINSTTELLNKMIEENVVDTNNIISIIFTATNDLNAVYPAVSARELNIVNAGLLCMQEMYVEGSLKKCIRILMNVDKNCKQGEIKHIYLKKAIQLRPDLCKINIAIDGPAGAGKSTIAKLIAKKLDINYVDTGAMYRTIALYCLQNNLNTDSVEKIKKVLYNIDIKVKYINKEQNMYLFNKNVTKNIRTQEVGSMASEIAVIKEVRDKLVDIQKKIAEENDVVMDGRDIGTYVLPNATLKIYLTASVDERARRRYNELVEKGQKVDLSVIKSEIKKRDNRDMTRKFAPLKKADDAVEINTTNLSIDEVVNKVYQLIRELI